jgi:hypothetical protein
MYLQLISYVVVRTTSSGRPVFEAGGSAVDHAHDALMLALLAITQNYGEFSKTSYAYHTETFSNDFFMPKPGTKDDEDEKKSSNFITGRVQALSANRNSKRTSSNKISRKMF